MGQPVQADRDASALHLSRRFRVYCLRALNSRRRLRSVVRVQGTAHRGAATRHPLRWHRGRAVRFARRPAAMAKSVERCPPRQAEIRSNHRPLCESPARAHPAIDSRRSRLMAQYNNRYARGGRGDPCQCQSQTCEDATLPSARALPSLPMMLLCVLVIRVTVMLVRFIAILLVAVLLPLSFSLPSAMACSTTECCGANCAPGSPVSAVNCCKAPVAPDRAVSQAQDAHHFDSIATMPVAGVIVAISHLQRTVVARGYSPLDRPPSLALLCSRQI